MRPTLLLLTALSLLPAAAVPPVRKAAPASLRVAAVQMRSKPDLDANVKHTIELLEKCAADKADVAVFPECNVSGYFDDYVKKLTAKQLEKAEADLCAACKRLGIWAIVGTPVRQDGKLYNSAV